MKKENDIVDDIFTRIKAILGDEFKGQIVVRMDDVETKIRQDWGGTEPYISKKRIREKKKEEALKELRRGVKIDEVSRKTGVCRTVIYQLLKCK